MKPFEYLQPKTVKEACSLLSKYEGKAKLLAGGTDLLVSMKNRKEVPQYVIGLKAIPNLHHIHYDDGRGLKIGTLATLHEIESSPTIRERFPVLVNAACQMAVPAIRNMGTVGGNLCNAAPSADMAPPLIALGAKVKIESIAGERVVTVEEFFTGPGKTVLQADEILTEIQIPDLSPYNRCAYLKLPARSAIDLTVTGVAVMVTLDPRQANLTDIKIALGAVGPTPIRALKAEGIIKGKVIEDELLERTAQAAADEARPRSSIRGSADYRRDMVKVLVRQALKQLLSV